MLTQRNVVSFVAGVETLSTEEIKKKERVHLSFLPLAHSFERVVQAVILGFGGSVGFYSGDIKNLVDDYTVRKK